MKGKPTIKIESPWPRINFMLAFANKVNEDEHQALIAKRKADAVLQGYRLLSFQPFTLFFFTQS